ncbi:MAG: sulfotransferase family protein [Pseudomonadales bacterium]
MKIIGAGFGRTGTLSLKFALDLLGQGPCYHMMEVYKNPGHLEQWLAAQRGAEMNWGALFADYPAAVDWPSSNFWQSQLDAFPDAKVILSLRDGAAWHRSVMNTIYPMSMAGLESDDPARAQHAAMATELIWDGVFGGRTADAAHAIAVFDAHNRAVIDAVPAEQLLQYQPGDGWQPLCDFLGCPIPEQDYPSVNSTEEFQSMWQKSE